MASMSIEKAVLPAPHLVPQAEFSGVSILEPERRLMGQLRDRMEQDLMLRGLAPSTRRVYLIYCRKFAAFFMRSPEELGEAEIRKFLLHLIQVEQVSYPTYVERSRSGIG
jgi:hypothetical protein